MDRCEHGMTIDLRCINCLAIENEELKALLSRSRDEWERSEARVGRLCVEVEELEKDKALVEWYFSPKPKFGFLNEYLQGIHQGWTVDQWRARCHAAMQAEGDAE